MTKKVLQGGTWEVLEGAKQLVRGMLYTVLLLLFTERFLSVRNKISYRRVYKGRIYGLRDVGKDGRPSYRVSKG